jgi:hypothetical protein
MMFDAKAYAEGICNSAAGSTIEVLVDTIDATLGDLDQAMELHAGAIVGNGKYDEADREHQDVIDDIQARKEHWQELRDAISENEGGL